MSFWAGNRPSNLATLFANRTSLMRTEEVERARAREREHFYQRDSAYPAFINFKLFDNEL